MNKNKINKIKQIIKELSEISDDELRELLSSTEINDFWTTFLDPGDIKNYSSIAEFLLAKKTRLNILAFIRYLITNRYSIKVTKDKHTTYISPCHFQWFDDGILYTEGKEPFQGLLYLYRNREANLVVFRRDARPGEKLGPNDVRLISVEKAKELLSIEIPDPKKPIDQLNRLLVERIEDESKYQDFFKKYPWIFGLEYSCIQDHRALDDENVPDFTGVRIRDNYRDIIEIKQPFLPIFRKDMNFTSKFNESWSQLVRYLTVVRQQKHYLQDKGLNFDNPEAILIIGYKINDDERKKIKVYEAATSGIKIYTYDDVMKYMKHTINMLKTLKVQEKIG